MQVLPIICCSGHYFQELILLLGYCYLVTENMIRTTIIFSSFPLVVARVPALRTREAPCPMRAPSPTPPLPSQMTTSFPSSCASSQGALRTSAPLCHLRLPAGAAATIAPLRTKRNHHHQPPPPSHQPPPRMDWSAG